VRLTAVRVDGDGVLASAGVAEGAGVAVAWVERAGDRLTAARDGDEDPVLPEAGWRTADDDRGLSVAGDSRVAVAEGVALCDGGAGCGATAPARGVLRTADGLWAAVGREVPAGETLRAGLALDVDIAGAGRETVAADRPLGADGLDADAVARAAGAVDRLGASADRAGAAADRAGAAADRAGAAADRVGAAADRVGAAADRAGAAARRAGAAADGLDRGAAALAGACVWGGRADAPDSDRGGTRCWPRELCAATSETDRTVIARIEIRARMLFQ
jgi:hypothetical protein